MSLVNIEALTVHSLARLILRTVPGAEPTVHWGVDTSQVVVSQCLESLRTPADHYLRRSPATAERLLSALRVRGVDASAWKRVGGEPLVAELLVAYTDMLRRHGAVDATGTLLLAAEYAPEFVRLRKPTLLLKLDDVQFRPGERQLLGSLKQLIPAVETIGHVPDKPPQRAVMRRITARDRDHEVTQVLGDILATGTPFDEVQIALAQPSAYTSRVAAAAQSHGIPVVMEHGVRFFDSPSGRHVRSLLKWLSEGLRPEHATACARLGMFNQDDASPERRRDVELLFDMWPVDVAELLTPSYTALLREAAGRRGGAVDSLAHFARMHLKELLDADGQLRADMTLYGIMHWVQDVLRHAPDRDAEWTPAIHSALRGRAAQVAPASITLPVARAADVLLRSLAGVGISGDRLLGDDLPGDNLLGDNLPGDDTSRGRILVVPLEQAALSLRRKTWVLGMDDRAPPGSLADDTAGLPRSCMDVLRALGYDSDTTRSAPVPLGRLLDRLSVRTEEMTLCLAAYDVREARELFPHAACAGREPSSATPEPVPLVPVLVSGAREGVLRAIAAWQERLGPSWTAQNGILGHVEIGHVERRRSASASSLERLSACPYRYFITDLLRVRPEERRTEWLTAAERGSLMHDVFRDAHARGLPGRTGGLDALLAGVRGRLDTHARLSPPPGAYTRMATEQELISMVRTLRALAEQEAGLWMQTEAEWDFKDVEAGPWLLRGRVDRVDVNESGQERILDYKTGSSRRFDAKKLTSLQHYLQWYVYALARNQSVQADVVLSGYLFMKDGEWATQQGVAQPLQYDGMEHLEVLAGRVDAGWFPQAAGHRDSPCTFCDVRPICGDVDMLGTFLKQKESPNDAFAGQLASWWYAEKQLLHRGAT